MGTGRTKSKCTRRMSLTKSRCCFFTIMDSGFENVSTSAGQAFSESFAAREYGDRRLMTTTVRLTLLVAVNNAPRFLLRNLAPQKGQSLARYQTRGEESESGRHRARIIWQAGRSQAQQVVKNCWRQLSCFARSARSPGIRSRPKIDRLDYSLGLNPAAA